GIRDRTVTGVQTCALPIYFDRTLFQLLPRLHEDLQGALNRYYPGVQAPRRWLSFGSWIGGDRDGNPGVTAAVTADVLRMNRRMEIGRASCRERVEQSVVAG